MRHGRFIEVALVMTIVALTPACGSSSGDGSGTTGAAGSGTAGTGGDATGGGPPAGLMVVSCNKPADQKCTVRGMDTDAEVTKSKTSCTDAGGTVVEHCPSVGLVGCCLIVGLGDCFYDASAATPMSVCGSGWTTTPP